MRTYLLEKSRVVFQVKIKIPLEILNVSIIEFISLIGI